MQAVCNPQLPYFTKLPVLEKTGVSSHLTALETILNSLDARAASSAPTLARAFLKHMGYTVSDEVWQFIDDADVVDIYGTDNRLKFATLRLFEAVSYSLEDLYCRTWMELYHRSREDDLQQIYKVCEDIIVNSRKGVVDMESLPLHSCTEIDSPLKRQFVLRAKVFTPVHKADALIGFLTVNRGSVFEKK
jgi:hypothetical protein